MSDRTSKKVKRRKPRKHVEYRYFIATPDTGVLGGIVAGSATAAEAWARMDYARCHDKRVLVRVRMEYKL